MSASKIIIIGEPVAGKQTLLRYLYHLYPDMPVRDLNDEILYANGEVWPHDALHRHESIMPSILGAIAQLPSSVLMADYIPTHYLRSLRRAGFRVYVLEVSRQAFLERQHARITHTHHRDVSAWVLGHHEWVESLVQDNLIDGYIDGEGSAEQIGDELVKLYRLPSNR